MHYFTYFEDFDNLLQVLNHQLLHLLVDPFTLEHFLEVSDHSPPATHFDFTHFLWPPSLVATTTFLEWSWVSSITGLHPSLIQDLANLVLGYSDLTYLFFYYLFAQKLLFYFDLNIFY